MAYNPRTYKLLGVLKNADLNTTSDQAIPILSSSKYIVDKIIATNVSTTLAVSIAAGGVYTATSKGGTAIVAAGQLYTALTAASKFSALTIAVTTDSFTAQTLYLSLTVAHGVAATADIYIYGFSLE